MDNNYVLQTVNELGTELINEKLTKNNLAQQLQQARQENDNLRARITELEANQVEIIEEGTE